MRNWLSIVLVLMAAPVVAHEQTVLGQWCPVGDGGGSLEIGETEIRFGESTFCDLSEPVKATDKYQATISCANFLSPEHRAEGGGAFRNTFEIIAHLGDDGRLSVNYVGTDPIDNKPLPPETHELCEQ
jgi:hypothetical protein